MEPSRDQDLEQTTIALWQTPILLFLRILKLESLSIPPFLLATLFFFCTHEMYLLVIPDLALRSTCLYGCLEGYFDPY
jgi:hypothetical protein